MTVYEFFSSCVSWDSGDVHCAGGLNDLIASRLEVTRKTLLQHVADGDLRRLEEQLCYASHPSRGLTMAADWHVEYFRSLWHGRRVYGFRHSAIEYVFASARTIEEWGATK